MNNPVSVTSGASGGLTLALDDGGGVVQFGTVVTGDAGFRLRRFRRPTDAEPDGIHGEPGERHHHPVRRLQRRRLGRHWRRDRRAGGGGVRDRRGAVAVWRRRAGTSVTIAIDFSQPVSVNTSAGSPKLILNNGGTASYDAALSSAGSGALLFDYTVSSGQHTPDLEITTVSSGGAVITDSHSVAVDFSAALSAPLGLGIELQLKVSAVTTSQAVFADTGQSVQLAVSMSEAVLLDPAEAFGLPTLSLNDGATAFLGGNDLIC